MLIGEKDFKTAINNLVCSNKWELRGNNSNKMCFITTHWDDTILVPDTTFIRWWKECYWKYNSAIKRNL